MVNSMIVGGVVAMTRQRVIGRGGSLPWRIPSDLERFKKITSGRPGENHAVIMGRTTWSSLPNQFRPLPGRLNYVLSRTPALALPGAEVHENLESALSSCHLQSVTHAWIIGGREVYSAALELIQILHITWVEADVEGDVRFPEYGLAEWRVVNEVKHMSEKDEHPTTYVMLERPL